jgi:hypothetical protein
MRLTTLPTVCIFFLAFIASAISHTNLQDHRTVSRLKARGQSVSTSRGKIHVPKLRSKSGIILDLDDDLDEESKPRCDNRANKKWHCEYACRCRRDGEVQCGHDAGGQFRSSWRLGGPLPADQQVIQSTKLTSLCAPLCDCSHMKKEAGAGPSRSRLPQALSSEAGPSRERRPEASSSGAGPSVDEASSSGAGPSREQRPETEEAPSSDPAPIQGPSESGTPQILHTSESDPGPIRGLSRLRPIPILSPSVSDSTKNRGISRNVRRRSKPRSSGS